MTNSCYVRFLHRGRGMEPEGPVMNRTPTLLSQSGGRHRRDEGSGTCGGRSLGLRVTAVVSLAAKDAYQKAIDSGSADAAPMAAIGLGELLADEGDLQGAKEAFQKAIDSGS